MKKSHLRTILILSALAALSASAGCGQIPSSNTPAGVGSGSGTGSGSGSGAGSAGGTAANFTPTGTPTYDFHFEVTGAGTGAKIGGGALAVATDSTLQVTLQAGAGMALASTGYTTGFNCEWFTVTVGNVSQTAVVAKSSYTDVPLQNGWMSSDPCAGAATSWSYDFSSALGQGHTGSVPIVISQGQYDNCHRHDYLPSFIGKYYGGCEPSAVYVGDGTAPDSIDAYLQVYTN